MIIAIWGTDPHGPLLKRHCQLRPDGEFEKCLLLNPEGPDGVMIGFTCKLPTTQSQFMYLYFMIKCYVRFTFRFMHHILKNNKSCIPYDYY